MKWEITMSAKRTPTAQMPLLDVEDGPPGASDNRGLTGLFLPGLIDRPDHQAAAPAAAARRLLQPRRREPAHHGHRGERVPARVIEQPLGLIWRPVPGMPGDAPPVHLR